MQVKLLLERMKNLNVDIKCEKIEKNKFKLIITINDDYIYIRENYDNTNISSYIATLETILIMLMNFEDHDFVFFITDDTIYNGLKNWRHKWRNYTNWKTNKYKDIQGKNLWILIDDLIEHREISVSCIKKNKKKCF